MVRIGGPSQPVNMDQDIGVVQTIEQLRLTMVNLLSEGFA